MKAGSSITLKHVNKDTDRLLKFIEKSKTQEPKSGAYSWQTGPSHMRDVVTFRTEGKGKGSLERFAEANKIPKKVYTMMRDAVAYGAHSTQGSVRGVLAFEINDKNMAKLEKKLDALFAKRDADKNGVLDTDEQAKLKKTKNGAAYLAGHTTLGKTKLTGLRTEHKFSRQVTYLVDQMYSKGSIYGPNHIDKLVAELPKAEGLAVRKAYAAVSRYMSKGKTGKMNFICRDQRREVTRGLMRVYGASFDSTEKAISALKVPSGY